MIYNLSFKVQWKDLLESRKNRLIINNEQENRSRIPHTYTKGEQVLVNRNVVQSKMNPK